MDKFDSKEVEFSLQNSFDLTEQFMRSRGMEYEGFDNRRIIEKTDELLKLCFPGFPDSVDNSKREMNLEEIIVYLHNERLLSDNAKLHLNELARIIESYGDARQKLASYCENVDMSIDDTTKIFIFLVESIYSSSFDWWNNKFGKMNKATVTILAKADVAGGIIYAAGYVGYCLLNPNCRFSIRGMLGGMAGTAAAVSFFKKIRW